MTSQQRLANVKEGMAVYDSGGDHIGTVKEVFFGAGSDEAEAYTTQNVVGPNDGGIAPDIADTLDTGSDLPDMLRRRLLTHGYIRIDRGFGDDHYATADLVTGVSDDGVRLSVAKDALVH